MTSHLLLLGCAVTVVMGAIVRIALGGGWVSWAVLVFAGLAAVQGWVNYQKLRSLSAQLAADPELAGRIHAIPRVPLLQGFVGRGS